jgi:hypothetical protein
MGLLGQDDSKGARVAAFEIVVSIIINVVIYYDVKASRL